MKLQWSGQSKIRQQPKNGATFAKTNKENITFKDLLTHYAGLQAWIPFYKATLNSDNTPMEKYYRKVPIYNFD
jgi:CubicO group peptidase (beta-lactamase class C family)